MCDANHHATENLGNKCRVINHTSHDDTKDSQREEMRQKKKKKKKHNIASGTGISHMKGRVERSQNARTSESQNLRGFPVRGVACEASGVPRFRPLPPTRLSRTARYAEQKRGDTNRQGNTVRTWWRIWRLWPAGNSQ